jgi:uncharacterized protein
MKISRDLAATTIRRASAAGVEIAGVVYADTLAVAPDSVHANWTEKPVDALTPDDFESLLSAHDPDVVLLGTGPELRFAPRELVFALARRSIGFEVMDTKAAARTFNVLAGEGRRVAAVLYPPGAE